MESKAQLDVIIGIISIVVLTFAAVIIQFCGDKEQDLQSKKQEKLLKLIDNSVLANYWQAQLLDSEIGAMSIHLGAELRIIFDGPKSPYAGYPEIMKLKKDYSEGKISADDYFKTMSIFHRKKAETFGGEYNKELKEYVELKSVTVWSTIKHIAYVVQFVALFILLGMYFYLLRIKP